MAIYSNASPSEVDLTGHTLEDVQAAIVHLEDLEVFVGQRSRLHPGPGWDIALGLVRRDLALLQAERLRRTVGHRLER